MLNFGTETPPQWGTCLVYRP